MAIGTVTRQGFNHTIELLASATATNSPPSGATAGLDVGDLYLNGEKPDVVSLLIFSTAGSDAMTVTCRIWGYNAAATTWFPLGVGTAAGKGVLNGGAAIAETEADKIAHAEPLDLPLHFTRLYLEITAIGGTSTAVTGLLSVGLDKV